jgi:hypothetical protein
MERRNKNKGWNERWVQIRRNMFSDVKKETLDKRISRQFETFENSLKVD